MKTTMHSTPVLTPLARSILLMCGAICTASLMSQSVWATEVALEASAADAGQESAIEQVQILGQRATVENAIKAQKEAPNLINMVTADTIRKLPDVNVAEAVARLPGISLETDTGEGRFVNIRGLDSNLNGTTFAGLRLPPSNPASGQNSGRAVAFDAIPNGLVGSITVTKTNLPEMDAEALGGTIEISPKTAPQDGKSFVDGHVGTGYERLRGTPITDLSVSGGGRFGGSGESTGGISSYSDKPFSFVGTAAYYEDKRGIDDVEPAYLDDGIHASHTLAQIDLRHYQYNRIRHGVGFDLGFQPDADNSFYLRAFDAGYTENKSDNHLAINMAGNPTANANGGFTDGISGIDQKLSDEKEKIDKQVFMTGGQNKFGGNVLDYRLGYTKGSYKQFYSYGSDFNYTPADGTISYNNTGPGNLPLFNIANAGYLNQNNYVMAAGTFSNATQIVDDHEWSLASNLKMPVTWGGYEQESVKFGFDTRFRTHDQSNPSWSYPNSPAINLASVTSGGNVTFYHGIYEIVPEIPKGVLPALFAQYATAGAGDIQTNEQALEHDTENVNSVYWQYQMKSGKLGVITGLRIENTIAKYDAIADVTNASGNDVYTPVSSSHNYTNPFPTIQGRYELDSNSLLRGSFSSTIARPGFQQITSAVVVSDANNTVSIGNPDLKPTTANSFDVSYELYLAHSGIFSVGAFDKEIKNYIASTGFKQNFDGSGIYNGLTGLSAVSSYINLDKGYARGLEFNYEQKFRELPEFWNRFGAVLNYTFVDSGANIHPGYTSMLPSTSKNNYNVEMFYEHEGLDLRIGVNYVSADLWAIGGNANTPDVFSDARLQADFGGSYEINDKLSFYFAAKNILNTPLKFYEGSPDRPIQREFYGPTFTAGVNFSY